DVERGQDLASRLDVGVASVNNHSFTGAVVDLPWTGTRDTGFGVANSIHALGTYVRPRALIVDESRKPDLFWMPWNRELFEFGSILGDAQLLKLRDAWRLPLLAEGRLRRIREFFRR